MGNVPDTTTFSFADVTAIINASSLTAAFAGAVSGQFDSRYANYPANSLLRFRNYGIAPIVVGTTDVLFYNAQYPGEVYSYNTPTKVSTLLTIPSITPYNRDIAHTANKLWIADATTSNGTTVSVVEWNITLNPFTAVYNRTITNVYYSQGLAALNDTTLVSVRDSTGAVYESDITTTTAVNTFKFNMLANRYVAGDFLVTTTRKFIVTTGGGESTQYITQYNYDTGTMEVDVNISGTVTTPYGIFEYGNEIYITDNSQLYHINKTTPYALALYDTTAYSIEGASQLPSVLTTHLTPASVPVITLVGASTQTVLQNGTYTEYGATASDSIDGNITANIVTTGSVNTAVVGTYYKYYNVTNSFGTQAVQGVRTISVTAPAATLVCLYGAANYNATPPPYPYSNPVVLTQDIGYNSAALTSLGVAVGGTSAISSMKLPNVNYRVRAYDADNFTGREFVICSTCTHLDNFNFYHYPPENTILLNDNIVSLCVESIFIT